jgi:hypothetical protein
MAREVTRAELLAWINSLLDVNNERIAWEAERESYLDAVSAASRACSPMPPLLRAAPVTEDDLERMAGAPP